MDEGFSRADRRGGLERVGRAPLFVRKDRSPPPAAPGGEVTVKETGVVESYDFPVVLDKPPHQPHLENFFDSIRGRAKLTCPAEVALRTEAVIWKAYAALDARKMLDFRGGFCCVACGRCVTAPGLTGDWSIFRPKESISRANGRPKRWTCPLHAAGKGVWAVFAACAQKRIASQLLVSARK